MNKLLLKLYVGGFLIMVGFAAAVLLILWLGNWNATTQPSRVDHIATLGLSGLALAALFGGGSLLAGPLRTFTFKAGPVEASLTGDDDGHE